MLKLFILSAFPLFVLMSGLISCSSDKHTTDVFAAPQPLVNGQGLAGWDAQTKKTLDIRSRIDLSAAQPTHFTVTSRCLSDGKSWDAKFSFGNEHQMQVLQVLPEEILLMHPLQAACEFELDLYNASESNHIFHIPSVPLSDQGGGELIVSYPPSPAGQPLRIPTARAFEARLQHLGRDTTDVQLSCADFSATQSAGRSMDLGSFDLERATLRVDRPADILSIHFVQTCRAITWRGDRRINVSDIFHLVFPLAPLVVTLSVQPFSEQPQTEMQPALTFARPVTIAEWIIHNPAALARTLQIPIARPRVGFDIYIRWLGETTQRLHFDKDWLNLVMPTVVPAHGEVRVQAVLEPKHVLFCRNTHVVGLAATLPRLTLIETTPGYEAEHVDLPLTQTLNFSHQPLSDFANSQLNDKLCDWGNN